MSTHLLDDLIIKPQPLTGRMRSFIPATPELDSTGLSDANVAGGQLFKAGNTYYREAYPTGETHRVNVLELGLVPDGVTCNAKALADAMSRLPKNTTFFFPAASKPYLFGPLPDKYNNFDHHQVAINCDTSGAWFVGEGDNSVIELTDGTAGIQVTGGLAPRITVIRDLTILGPSKRQPVVDIEKPVPDPTNGYYYNGINAYGQVILDNVNVRNCLGHGVKIFGLTSTIAADQERLRVKGVFFDVPGEIDGSYFYPTDTSVQLNYGWLVNYQGFDTKFGGNLEQVGTPDQPRVRIAIESINVSPSAPATIKVTPLGGPMVADNCDIYGGNFDFNEGCGIFIQGNDANQTRIWGGSMRENWHWGLYDYSFLGTFCYGTHFTGNGKAYNIPDEDKNKAHLVVGPYITVAPTARSAYFGVYTEGGNQGPAYIARLAQVYGGLQGANLTGPGYSQQAVEATNLVAGLVHFEEYGMLFNEKHDSLQPITFRKWPWGLGFGFGNKDLGQGQHPILSILRGNESIVDPAYTDDPAYRVAPLYGTQINTLYHGPFCHLVAGSLVEVINLLNSVSPSTDVFQGDTVTLRNNPPNSTVLTPRKYTCYAAGTPATAKWRPEGYGIGDVATRPAASDLTANDTGWRWYDPATNQFTTFNGAQWA